MARKRILKWWILMVIIFSLPFICAWGYWEYLNYKFEHNPQYFYKPSPYIKFLQEWNEVLQEDSLEQDSVYSPSTATLH